MKVKSYEGILKTPANAYSRIWDLHRILIQFYLIKILKKFYLDECYISSVTGRSVGLRHFQATRLRKSSNCSCPNVGGLSVPSQCCSSQDPHCHDDHHLQEDLWQPRHSMEVSVYIEMCPSNIIYSLKYKVSVKTSNYDIHDGVHRKLLKNLIFLDMQDSTWQFSSLTRIRCCLHPSHSWLW